LHNHALNQVRYIAINSFWRPLEFELPTFVDASSRWMRMIDTSLRSPLDVAKVGEGLEIDVPKYLVNPHSIIMLHHASTDAN
jgi:pullulanase/glycogen debranching enzyme